MTQTILKKIDVLIDKFSDPAYPDDILEIKEWHKAVQTAMLKKDLRKHEGVQMLVEKLREDVIEIGVVLGAADSTKLPDRQRDRLLDRKELYLWFLGFFSRVEEELAIIDKAVDEETKNLEAQTT